MKTPEEVVDEFAADQDTAPGWGMSEADRDRLAALIRARDAEVAAKAWDEALAGAVTVLDERKVRRYATYAEQIKAETLAGVAERLAESGRLWHGSAGVSVMWNLPYNRTTPLFDWLRAGAPPFDDSGEAGLEDLQRCVADARKTQVEP